MGGNPLKAAILEAPGRFDLAEVDEPSPRAGSTLIRTRAVGLCGTDAKIISGRIPVDYPRVIGHEIGGEVQSDPTGRLDPGTPVVIDPGIACGVCPQCRAGRENICTGGWLIGRDRDGGLREFVEVPAENVHPLPDRLPTDLAPLVQVLATCVHGQELMPVLPGSTVVVLGLGVTGLLHLQLAKRSGAGRLVGVSRSRSKLDLASAFGADATAEATHGLEPILEAADGGADLVIECVGSVETLARAVEIARVGGSILAYGTISETEGSFPYYSLYYKELLVGHPRSARASDFPTAIETVASGKVDLAPLVSHRFPLSRIHDAVVAADAPGALKVLIDL